MRQTSGIVIMPMTRRRARGAWPRPSERSFFASACGRMAEVESSAEVAERRHSGILLAQRSTFPRVRWERRHAELCVVSPGGPPSLLLSAEDSLELLDSLVLDGAESGALPHEVHHKTASCFFVQRRGKTVVFGAVNEVERTAWLDALAHACASTADLGSPGPATPQTSRPGPASPTPGPPTPPRSSARAALGPRPDELAALAASPARSNDAAPRDTADMSLIDESTAELVALNAVWRDIVAAKDDALAAAAVGAASAAAAAEAAATAAAEAAQSAAAAAAAESAEATAKAQQEIAALTAALAAAEEAARASEEAACTQRVRAERTALRAEEERSSLLAAIRRRDAAVRHFQGLSRRAFAQLAAGEAALAAARLGTDTEVRIRSSSRTSWWAGSGVGRGAKPSAAAAAPPKPIA